MPENSPGVQYGALRLARRSLAKQVWPNGPIPHSAHLSRCLAAVKAFPQQDALLFVDREDMPADVMVTFDAAGGAFRRDFERFCRFVAFASHLNRQYPDGSYKYERGFCIGIETVPAETIEEQPPIPPERTGTMAASGEVEDLARIFGRQAAPFINATIFINSFTQGGDPIFGVPFFPHLAHELGHLRNNEEIHAAGRFLSTTSTEAKEFYALAYERRAAQAIVRALTQIVEGGKNRKKWPDAYRNFVRSIEETARSYPAIGTADAFMGKLLRSCRQAWLPDTHQTMLVNYRGMVANGESGLYSLSPADPQRLKPFDSLDVRLTALRT
ncbi:MAG: hypothetical protein NT099_03075 [Candidatus Saganbacteria bacterium]|nr:hypothetical protein [Candidatus Saganbacteria bacterium]